MHNDMEEWKHANPRKGKLRIAMILWAMLPLRTACLRIALLLEIFYNQKNIIIFLY